MKHIKRGHFIKPAHRSVARAIGFGLCLRDESAMWQVAAVMHARLKPQERMFLAAAANWSLTEDEYLRVIRWVEGPA